MIIRIVVLFDSVTNSVFEGQTLQLLVKTAHEYTKTIIVTFEKQLPSPEIIQTISAHGFECIIKKKLPFIVQEQLLLHSWWLKRFLKKIGSHFILARGPHAGYIALKARTDQTNHILVQARGLCAEEYTYFHTKQNFIQKVRYHLMKRLERYVYGYKVADYTIEAVSKALKEYLIEEFFSNAYQISIADQDIPKIIDHASKISWRKNIREELKLALDQEVYCYSGSAKPWQCAHESIEYFRLLHEKNNNIHLLIISQDKNTFLQLCQKHLPANSYTIKTASSKNIYHYLAAADYGIILRKPHVINWVSRPTKWLEYKAAGLQIIHNQTIACLVEDL